MRKRTDQDPRDVGLCLQQLYLDKQWQGQWPLLLLSRRWHEVVGPELAAHTMPAFFRHEILWVQVRNSALMHHLHMLKPQLLEQIRSIVRECEVEDLRWQLQSELPVAEAKKELVGKEPADPVAMSRFARMAQSVAHRESREALCRLWRSCAENRLHASETDSAVHSRKQRP